MSFDEIVEEMSRHYDNDVDYHNIGADNNDGSYKLDYRVTFELVNEVPTETIAPFFPVASVDEAKAVFLAVEPKLSKAYVDGIFDQALLTLPVDLSKPLYFTMYKTPRLSDTVPG